MNIFYLDKDITKCVEALCDKHVVKMSTETVQIISTAYFLLSGAEGVYKPTHNHHPCVKWAVKSFANFKWLCEYAFALGLEYTKRYNKLHLAIEKLNLWTIKTSLNELPFLESCFTDPPQCMPDKYKNQCVIQAYRDYYKGEKLTFAKWKFTKIPEWL
jgi:hypothetical protein